MSKAKEVLARLEKLEQDAQEAYEDRLLLLEKIVKFESTIRQLGIATES